MAEPVAPPEPIVDGQSSFGFVPEPAELARDPAPAITSAEPSAAHTPGPWEWDTGLVPPDGPQRYADIYTDGGETIIANFNDLIPEGRANARLIAAAPELLAALRLLANDVAQYEAWARPCHALDVADAAIAKAEGRS